MTRPGSDEQRAEMVRSDIAGRAIADERVIEAMLAVPREAFVPATQVRHAYEDRPLPIGKGQTISQPYVVALMLEALRLTPTDSMLEVGSGSGYAAAVAGRIVQRVLGLERVPELAEASAQRLSRLGASNVEIIAGDGSCGWSRGAPYDAILVSAAAPAVPTELLDQLAEGGRLVIPVSRSRWSQQLQRITRHGDRVEVDDLGGVAFVPLIGASGWSD